MGRTGAFICMHAEMEKMKSEGVVDIFQFLKSVPYQRAKLVCNKVSKLIGTLNIIEGI